MIKTIDTSMKEMDILPRHKWEIIRFMGCPFPKLACFQKEIIRKQLEERYCSRCGEYIYNPYAKRKIRHYHTYRKYKYTPLFMKRIKIHPKTQLVEWTRHFPHVMRLLHSSADIVFYGATKPRFSQRIPSLRMWSIDEWNLTYPTMSIWKEDALLGYSARNRVVDVLMTPNLLIV